MRCVPLFLALVACGGTHVAQPAAAPASARIRPPMAELPSPPAEPAEDEAEPPTPTLRVTKLTPTPVQSKNVTKTAPQDVHDVVDERSIDEPGRRPLLTLQGSPAPSPAGRSAEASSTWGVETSGPRPSALDPQARAAYKSAYRIYSERKPREALDAFAAFVLKYPDHPYVEQATFWRGECYAALGDREHALEQFRGVTARFPGTPKAHEAQARIAALTASAQQGTDR